MLRTHKTRVNGNTIGWQHHLKQQQQQQRLFVTCLTPSSSHQNPLHKWSLTTTRRSPSINMIIRNDKHSSSGNYVFVVPLLQQQQQMRTYMSSNEQFNTLPLPTPTYHSSSRNLNAQNYVVLFCNPRPTFLKYTCIASIVYTLALLIASYNLFMSSLEKQKKNADLTEFSFDTNMKLSAGLTVVAALALYGFAYYAKKNILEFGLIKNQVGKVTEARIVFGNMFSKTGTTERFYSTSELTTPSLHMLKINPVADPKSGTTDKTVIRKRRMFGDYMFLNIQGSKYNYLMDLTNQRSFTNRSEMDTFFRSNIQNKKVDFK